MPAAPASSGGGGCSDADAPQLSLMLAGHPDLEVIHARWACQAAHLAPESAMSYTEDCSSLKPHSGIIAEEARFHARGSTRTYITPKPAAEIARRASSTMTLSEPTQADALFARADALDDEGNQEDALNVLDDGVLRFPWAPRLWVLRGHILHRLGRYAPAEASFSEALALQPTLPFALFMRGRAREELGRPAEAAIDFLACIACQPSHVDAYLAVVRSLADCKELRGSTLFLERAGTLELTPEEQAQLEQYRERLQDLGIELGAMDEPKL